MARRKNEEANVNDDEHTKGLIDEIEKGAEDEERAKAKDEDVVVDLDDEDEPKTEDDEEPSRKDRRRQRGDNRVREAEERARAAEERAERIAAETQARIDQILVQVRQPPSNEPKPKDQLDGERDSLRTEQRALGIEWQQANERAAKGQLTQAEIDKLTERANDLQERMQANNIKRTMRDSGMLRNQPTQQDVDRQTFIGAMRMAHPDVMGHPKGFDAFRTAYAYEVQVLGKPDHPSTIPEVMEKVRKDLGLKTSGRQGPTEATRRRFASNGGGRGPTGGGEAGERRQFVMTKEHRILANERFRNHKGKDGRPISEKERFRLYAKEQSEGD